jgi:hypothetical protein
MKMNTSVQIHDGWCDTAKEANERLLKGTLIRFSDWRWLLGKEQIPIKEGTQFVPLNMVTAWVKWVDGKPSQTKVKEPGQRLLDREELGDNDQTAWAVGPDDKPRDPWQLTRFVHMISPTTAEAFTFSTSSWGGREAVLNLSDAIERMRSVHAGAVPVVELAAAPMQTRYGKKSKPALKIVAWKMLGGDLHALKELPAPAPKSVAEDLDDEIAF